MQANESHSTRSRHCLVRHSPERLGSTRACRVSRAATAQALPLAPVVARPTCSSAATRADLVAEPAMCTTAKSVPILARPTCSSAAARADLAAQPASDDSSTLRIISDMSPLPKAGPRVGKRRTQSVELLTSSPYKKMLEMKKCPDESFEKICEMSAAKKDNRWKARKVRLRQQHGIQMYLLR